MIIDARPLQKVRVFGNWKLVVCSVTLTALVSYIFLKKNQICTREGFNRRIHYVNRPEFISPDVFKHCEYACEMTEGEDYSASDIVVWHATDIHLFFPPEKYVNQIWVFHSMEPPPLHVYSYKLWDGLFNWTLSYRRDSDIYSPYGVFRTHPKGAAPRDIGDINWAFKTDEAVWFVSNCQSASLRADFVEELQKYMSIDIFGKCGKMNCSNTWIECVKYLQAKYKFYLSFENSICKDYITEKSIKIFASLFNAIPVTRTGANMTLYLPENSYISTNSFEDIKSLGSYLKVLGKTEITPLKYFTWRKYFFVEDTINSVEPFCELCRRSHTVDKYRRIYKSLDTWLRGDDYIGNKMCQPIRDIN